MKTDGMRVLGWAIPVLCMAVACWVVIRQNVAFQTASAARDQANRDVERAAHDYNETQTLPAEIRYAAVPDQANEEALFLDFLRKRATIHGVKLDNWNSQSAEYGKDKTLTADEKVASLLKGIRKRSSALSLSGPYVGLRDLVNDLESSDRLYTLSNVVWTHTEQGMTLHMSVSRYVAPAQAPASGHAPGMTITSGTG